MADKVLYLGAVPAPYGYNLTGPYGPGTERPISVTKQEHMNWFWKTKTWRVNATIRYTVPNPTCCFNTVAIDIVDYIIPVRADVYGWYPPKPPPEEMKDLVCCFEHWWGVNYNFGNYHMGLSIAPYPFATRLLNGSYYPFIEFLINAHAGTAPQNCYVEFSTYWNGANPSDVRAAGEVVIDGKPIPMSYIAFSNCVLNITQFSVTIDTHDTY